eukprot:scaffold67258_cov75-Phaeocystis_antarctica.AAC.2
MCGARQRLGLRRRARAVVSTVWRRAGAVGFALFARVPPRPRLPRSSPVAPPPWLADLASPARLSREPPAWSFSLR